MRVVRTGGRVGRLVTNYSGERGPVATNVQFARSVLCQCYLPSTCRIQCPCRPCSRSGPSSPRKELEGLEGRPEPQLGGVGRTLWAGGGVFDDISWSIVEVVGKEPRL